MKKIEKYGNIGNSGCPCGTYKTKGFIFESHCWRVCKTCGYSGVHIVKYPKGKLGEARQIGGDIANYIKESWSTGCELTTKKRT